MWGKKLFSYSITLRYKELVTFLFTSFVFYTSFLFQQNLNLISNAFDRSVTSKGSSAWLCFTNQTCSLIPWPSSMTAAGQIIALQYTTVANGWKMSESVVSNADDEQEEDEHHCSHIESMFTLQKASSSSACRACGNLYYLCLIYYYFIDIFFYFTLIYLDCFNLDKFVIYVFLCILFIYLKLYLCLFNWMLVLTKESDIKILSTKVVFFFFCTWVTLFWSNSTCTQVQFGYSTHLCY